MAAKFEEGSSTRVPDAARAREAALPTAAERRVTAADTLPPMPLKELLSAGGANLYVLSVDTELIDTVQRAGGEHFPVFPVATWQELEGAIETGRCGIALLDADLLGATLPARVAAVEPYSQRLVVLVAADRATAQTLMSLLSERKIHRLLIKPPALGITRILVESAVNRCLQLRELAKSAGDVGELPRQNADVEPRKGVPAWIFVAACAAMLAGVGTVAGFSSWWRSAPSQSDAPSALEAAGRAPTESPPQRFAELLARAERAFGEGRLAAPPGDNALDYYLVILAADPAEVAASAQLGHVVDALFAEAEDALLADAHERAAAALGHVRRADPTSSRLAFLETQLERARTAAAVVVAPVAAASPPVADVAAVRGELAGELVAAARMALANADIDGAAGLMAEAQRLGAESEVLALLDTELATARAARTTQRYAEWLALADNRLRSGALVAPVGDNAQHYLEQLEREAPGFIGLDAAWEAFSTALVAHVQGALAARAWDVAEAELAALQRVPQGSVIAAPLRAQLEFDRRQERYLAVWASASELTLVERASPTYPAEAERLGIEGWVDIEFVVDTAGRPKDLTVIGAEPTGRFEEAALAAISRYRYAPFERDGRLFERRLRLRTRFALQ